METGKTSKIMLITECTNGALVFSWYEYPHRKKVVTLSEDKVTRRRINTIFRAADGRSIVGKALRRLWEYERSGLVVPSAYEYALALNDFISMVVNNRYNSPEKTRYR